MTRARSSASITVLDDISGGFNGTTTRFTMRVGGVAYTVIDAYQLEIYIGDFLLKPYSNNLSYVYFPLRSINKQGYTVSGSTITFLNPPSANVPFYGRVMATSASNNSAAVSIYPFLPLDIALHLS
jgi:hypothetical protein